MHDPRTAAAACVSIVAANNKGAMKMKPPPRSPIVTVRKGRAKVWVGVGVLEIGKGGDQYSFLQERAPRLDQNPCDLLHDPLAGLAANKLEFDISDLRQLVPVGGHYEGTKYSL